MGKSAKVCSAVWGLYFIGKHQLFEIIEKTFFIFENFEKQSRGQLAPKSGAARA
jgi:hypothetical protein